MKSCKRVCALGFFDGVHLGHGEIIKKAKEMAADLEAVPCVLTFDRQPRAFLSGTEEKQLSPVLNKKFLVDSLFGDSEFIVLPFSRELSELSPADFVSEVLVKELGAVGVAAGRDYRFGKGAEGDIDLLKSYMRAELVETVYCDGEKVSSTRVRNALEKGDFQKVTELLGHPFLLGGSVCHGDGRGRNIGFATLNLPFVPDQIYPQNGVYSSLSCVGNTIYPSVTNLGNRPTFYSGGIFTNETHIIGASPDLYEKEVWVWLCSYVREEKKFGSADELKIQVDADIAASLAVYERNSELIERIGRNLK